MRAVSRVRVTVVQRGDEASHGRSYRIGHAMGRVRDETEAERRRPVGRTLKSAVIGLYPVNSGDMAYVQATLGVKARSR